MKYQALFYLKKIIMKKGYFEMSAIVVIISALMINANLTNNLIRIYAVCYSVLEFGLVSLFVTVGVSKFKNGKVQCGNSGMKWSKVQ